MSENQSQKIHTNKMKVHLKLFCIVYLTSLVALAQPNAKQSIDSPKGKAIQVEQADLKIYLLGGIVTGISQKEVDFSKKYHVLFLYFGCLVPSNIGYYESQNFKAFDLLNIQFGPKWQEELKPSALGFSKWKEKNK